MTFHSRAVWAEIDLVALKHNISLLKRTFYPAELAAVVKANGYGHGAVEVAKTASRGGIRTFCVATVEEGVELKDAGVEGQVLVLMEPEREFIEDALVNDLTLTIYSVRALLEVVASWERIGRSGRIFPRPRVHIKVDTGMHRLGVTEDEALELAKLVKDSGVVFEGLSSHFAMADRGESGKGPTLEQLTKLVKDSGVVFEGLSSHFAMADRGESGKGPTLEQVAKFERVITKLATLNIRPQLLHIASTAGGIAYPAARYDLVRSGIGLYGYLPSPEVNLVGLKPILSLKARVSALRRLEAGEAVSYGLRRPLERLSYIATVPIGYADGVRRLLFDKGQDVLIKGERVPIAGTVTMDQTLIDCGDLEVSPGDEVVFLGRQGVENITALEWAESLNTIPYEILTSLGNRVPRIYVGEDLTEEDTLYQ